MFVHVQVACRMFSTFICKAMADGHVLFPTTTPTTPFPPPRQDILKLTRTQWQLASATHSLSMEITSLYKNGYCFAFLLLFCFLGKQAQLMVKADTNGSWWIWDKMDSKHSSEKIPIMTSAWIWVHHPYSTGSRALFRLSINIHLEKGCNPITTWTTCRGDPRSMWPCYICSMDANV